MKIYKRTDGFEVQDAKDRPIEWAVETYGGEFVEVISPAPMSQEERAKLAEIAEKKEFLAKSDYKILKKLEQMFLADDVDVLERQGKRNRINELEAL